MGMSDRRTRRTLPKFSQLWTAYPGENQPCAQTLRDGSLAWSNQCAIRLSISLQGAGFPLTEYTDPTCMHGHARGAESLANYLWRQVGPPADRSTQASEIQGKCGILFFRNIAGFRGGIGDHIDLWNLSKTQTGAYFQASNTVWFWQIS